MQSYIRCPKLPTSYMTPARSWASSLLTKLWWFMVFHRPHRGSNRGPTGQHSGALFIPPFGRAMSDDFITNKLEKLSVSDSPNISYN